MKLLICASEYFPHGSGIANVIYNVVEQLKKQGVECTVCSPTGPDIILGNKRLIDKFGFLGLLYYWHQTSQFFNKKNDYDVVWLQNPYFIRENPFARCLITMHSTYCGLSHHRVGNTFFLRIYYKGISLIERFCLKKISKTTLFTGVGESVCEELKKIGIDETQITYIPNGVDTRFFNPLLNKKQVRKKFGIPETDVIITSVGRLTPQKRPKILIDLFSLLERRTPNLTLCIVGKGELFEATIELVKINKLKKVVFLGYIDISDLPEIYACSDYFIITSIYEGGMPPLTLSEAMASGLPCIVSNIPPLNIVKDANCGIIVNFEDIENASDIIYRYLTGIHQDHSKNSRKYVEENLDWSLIAKYYFAALNKQCSYPIE